MSLNNITVFEDWSDPSSGTPLNAEDELLGSGSFADAYLKGVGFGRLLFTMINNNCRRKDIIKSSRIDV